MLKKILLILVLVIAGILGFAATKPDSFRVDRSIEISATPDVIFPLVNNLRANQQWSPWEKKDPNMKRTFSGPEEGVGAKYAWEGNHEVGQGEMTIAESTLNSKIVSDLHFIKPFEGTHKAEFTFVPNGAATTVTWSMYGNNNFIGKIMSVFMDCEKMIGDEFEKGLADLKTLAESNQADAQRGVTP